MNLLFLISRNKELFTEDILKHEKELSDAVSFQAKSAQTPCVRYLRKQYGGVSEGHPEFFWLY